jgi:DnaK suppressor protein
MGVADRESVLLRQVQTALARVENGGFGVCLSCENGIGMNRLAAVPWAMFCIVCQEDADRLLSKAFDRHTSPLLNAA